MQCFCKASQFSFKLNQTTPHRRLPAQTIHSPQEKRQTYDSETNQLVALNFARTLRTNELIDRFFIKDFLVFQGFAGENEVKR